MFVSVYVCVHVSSVLCVDSETSAVRSFGDTWLRWRGPRVEYCRCALRGRELCHVVPVTKCFVSQCYNGGTCKEAVYTSDYICQCPPGFTGTQCEINTNEKCIVGQGEGYRGTWSISHSGAECINWNSTSLRGRRFTARKIDASSLGLGNHNFCRNPDNDDTPWCYVYKGTQIVWEFCSLPKCPEATCGQRLDNTLNRPTFRLYGGRVSDITEQPWQAAINVYQARHKQHFFRCGGILIDSCWVLSAAHCFEDREKAEKLQVVLGRTFRKQNSSSEQIFKVEKYWIHEGFDSESYDNDIAILKLETDIGMCAVNSPEVFPACLPERGLALPDWTECEISGYGKDAEFSPMFSERVKRGYVRLWPKERCVPDVLSGRKVTANMLCAGDTRGLDDACKGDSGGPLVCRNNDRMTLMGVISWGVGCGQKETPGVYTRVTQYIDWINSKIKANPV
uniref:Uncharacterized protein n=1 Tax=Salarias fasciatus TaxID=181472 RepID=A0A672JDN2_SALFA